MGRHRRIRRKLTLDVTEPQTTIPCDPDGPGQRFAEGWQAFRMRSGPHMPELGGDPIKVAGFLAAQAAWNAHYQAINWIKLGERF